MLLGSGPFGITSADFDNDGIIDLAVVVSGSNNVEILLGNGDGTFSKPERDYGKDWIIKLPVGLSEKDVRRKSHKIA